MTKEDLLKIYMSDDLVKEKDYLKNIDIDKLKWNDGNNSKLISVIKLAIEGEVSRESSGVTIRKINQLLND